MKDVKDLLIKKIAENGYPVIAIFDYMDSGAELYAKSENEVIFGGAYGEYMQEGDGTTIQDVTLEGLFKLSTEGVRPGEKYWDDYLTSFEDEDDDPDNELN